MPLHTLNLSLSRLPPPPCPPQVPDLSHLGSHCAECGKACKHTHALLSHVKATGHAGGASECAECGRLRLDDAPTAEAAEQRARARTI